MQGDRVFVSGAGGFIGRWSVPALLRSGHEVHAVLSGSAGRDVPGQLCGAKIHFADLLDASRVEELMRDIRPSHLLHFAWITTPGLYWNSEENFRWLKASEHLLHCFGTQGGRRVMMAGSCAEYDWSRAEECDELRSPLANSATTALSPYAACKIALQASLADFGSRNRVSTAWGRIFFQFGPYEHPDRLVPYVISNLLLNREAACSHGKQVRSFLHVADVGAAFAAVLQSEVEGAVNIGSDERVSLADLIGRIARQIGRPELVRLGVRPSPPQEPLILIPDVHRLNDEARWLPRFSLDEGLADTIAWWRGILRSPTGTAAS
jgi:nucleoside-diphosphate-sugar epimerase